MHQAIGASKISPFIKLLSELRFRQRVVSLSIGIGTLGVLAFFISHLDLITVTRVLRSAELIWIGVAVALGIMAQVVKGYRWRLFLSGVGVSASWWDATYISVLGVLTGSIYPGLGEIVRLLLLRQRAISTLSALTIIMGERIVDGVFLGIVLIGTLSYYPFLGVGDLSTRVLMLAIVGVLVLVLVIGIALMAWLVRFPENYSAPNLVMFTIVRVHHWLQRVAENVRFLGRRPVLCVTIIGYTFCIHSFSFATGLVSVWAFGFDVPILPVIVLVTAISIGLSIIVTPAGLGVYQFAGIMTLGSFTGNREAAIAIATGLQSVNYGALVLVILLFAVLVQLTRHEM